MTNEDRYDLAAHLVHEANSEIHSAILCMHQEQRCRILYHLVTAKAYLHEATFWCECPQCEQRIARLIDIIEAVSKQQWETAWKLFWGACHSIDIPAPQEKDQTSHEQ